MHVIFFKWAFPAGDDFCRLLITFASSLDPDQDVGPDLNPIKLIDAKNVWNQHAKRKFLVCKKDPNFQYICVTSNKYFSFSYTHILFRNLDQKMAHFYIFLKMILVIKAAHQWHFHIVCPFHFCFCFHSWFFYLQGPYNESLVFIAYAFSNSINACIKLSDVATVPSLILATAFRLHVCR